MRRTRKPSNLSKSLQRHLNAYALAASAAGVGVLALSHSAEARIVYTKAHRHVVLGHPLSLDLDHDGIADFTISRGQATYSSTSNLWLVAKPAQGNSVAGFRVGSYGYTYDIAYALPAGKEINSGLGFQGFLMAERKGRIDHSGNCQWRWNNVTRRYLGLKFQVQGQTHYGWARLNASCERTGDVGIKALLTGYAYETIANKAIIAGKRKGSDATTLEPGSLGRLAQGSAGRLGK